MTDLPLGNMVPIAESQEHLTLPLGKMSPVKMATFGDITPCARGDDAARAFLLGGTTAYYPMYALPIQDVMALTDLDNADHKTLLKEKKLVKVNEWEYREVVFLSHQWLGEDHPDPKFEQLSVFQEAIKSIRSGESRVQTSPLQMMTVPDHAEAAVAETSKRITDELKNLCEDCLVWFDYWFDENDES
jgi:hypothetical protein